MSKPHRLLLILAVLAIAAPANAESAAPNETIRFDLGNPQTPTSGKWNQLSHDVQTGVVLRSAVDASGRATNVRVHQLDDWTGFNVNGFTGDGPHPVSAMRDSCYVGEPGDSHAKLRFDGLEPGEKYDFEFFASRTGVTDPRISVYRIGDQEQKLDATGNQDRTVAIRGAAAGSDGTLTLEVECGEGSAYAYLGVLEIHGKFADSTGDLDPRLPLTGPPLTMARAWVIGDPETGKVLWEKNSSAVRQMASTTKIMTAWIVLQLALEDEKILDEIVTISERSDKTGGSHADVLAGEKLPVRDLLYGLLLPSGNDAAVALAEHFGDRFDPPEDDANADSLARFVAEMNRRAEKLGMKETKYLDPHGNSLNRSSARDLLKLAYTAMKNPLLRGYVSTRHHECEVDRPGGGTRTATWDNTNKLLKIEGYDGVKTGTTGRAGECLVSSGHFGDDHLYVIVLGSARTDGRYVDSRNLYRWAWIQRGHLGKSPASEKQTPAAASR